MDQYQVDIKFPRPSDSNPDLVVISGTEEAIADARDHLLNLEEEFVSILIQKLNNIYTYHS